MRALFPLWLLSLGFAAAGPVDAGVPAKAVPADSPPAAVEAPVTPVPASQPISPEAARAIREVLELGFRDRQADPAAIERVASAAAASGPRDGRIDYAIGLVLLRQLKHREAAAAFERAAAAQPPSLPAWQALIRTHLVLNEADAALQHAEQLAARLADAHAAWPGDAARRSGAEWLGRLVGYLRLDGVELVQSPALLQAHETRARLALGEPWLADWQRGRESIHGEYQQLLRERVEARTQIATRETQQHAARTAEIDARKADLSQQAETLEMTAREWQTWLEDTYRKTDKQLEILQKDYAVLDAAARDVTNEILVRQRQLTALQLLGGQRPVVQRDRTRLLAQDDVTLIEGEDQIARLRLQFNSLAARAATVSAQARALLAQRTEAARRFERATGQLAKQDATLQKWEKLLEKSVAKNQPKTAAETIQYQSLTNRLTQLATYFELDLDQERRRLLAELSPEP